MRNAMLTAWLTAAMALAATAAPPATAPAGGGEGFPPVELIGGPTAKANWQAPAVVVDPVNNETLYLCGRVANAPDGEIGSWALAQDGRTWRRLTAASEALDPLRAEAARIAGQIAQAANAARVLRWSAISPQQRAAATKGEPAQQLAEAAKAVAQLVKSLDAAKPDGWQVEAIAHARPGVAEAAAKSASGAARFAKGECSAEALADCFAAKWALDEAAGALAVMPADRYGAMAAFDPQSKTIVLFGGSHGDYVTNETWLYDCVARSWRQVWPDAAPLPRMSESQRDRKSGKTSVEGTLTAEQPGQLVLAGGRTLLRRMVFQQGYTPLPADRWAFDVAKGQWTPLDEAAKAAPAGPAARTYRTVAKVYDPRTYDAAPDAEPQAVADWLAKLPANKWVEVPAAPAVAPQRAWGSTAYSPDHDQAFRWSGGHQADPANQVSTYFLGTNRWAFGYLPEIYGKGLSFTGRPDCMNHTYTLYAYDTVSKKLIAVTQVGTHVYDPARMDWSYTVASPFKFQIYNTSLVSTPHGVVVWTPGYFGKFDEAARSWSPLPLKGKLPSAATDGYARTYDSKRDCLWLLAFTGYHVPNGNMWKYDFATGEAKAMDPAGMDTIGVSKAMTATTRDSAYSAEADLVLLNNFHPRGPGGRQIAYDPAKNRWVQTSIVGLGELGTVDPGFFTDRRGLIWAVSIRHNYVLKVDAKTLELSETLDPPPPPAETK